MHSLIKPVLFAITMALFACVFVQDEAYAQNAVDVRTGSHDGYERVVIDWSTKVPYDVQRNGGSITLSFQRDATLESFSNVEGLSNIKSAEILSTSPLTLRFEVSPNSRHRSFDTSKKFVLDIYDPPGGRRSSNTGAQASRTQTDAVREDVPKPPAIPSSRIKRAEVAAVEAENVSELQPAPQSQNQEQEDEAQDSDDGLIIPKIKNPGHISANLIALSSVSSLGIAAFEHADKIWIINDDPNQRLTPQLTGPDIEYLKPLEREVLRDATMFSANALIGSNVSAQGGGLLWRIIVADTARKEQTLKPERIEASMRRDNEDDSREKLSKSTRMRWPMAEPSKIIQLPDPLTGKELIIVTSKTSADTVTMRHVYPEFEVLESAVGLVILPRVDDLVVKIRSGRGVDIYRAEGMSISSQNAVEELAEDYALSVPPETPENYQYINAKTGEPTVSERQTKRIYDFKNWQLGSIKTLKENRTIIMGELHDLPDGERDDAFMTLAKMYVSHAMGAEAQGFLYILEQENPGLKNTPEFRAIRGAASALEGHMEEAFRDIAIKNLLEYEEIGFWKSFILAELGDWQQAIDVLPDRADALYDYPPIIMNRIGLVIAEVVLRDGNTNLANDVLISLMDDQDSLNKQQKVALQYLKGEAARQNGNLEKTKELWEPLLNSRDDLYRAKAGLALTRLLVNEEELTPGKAIDSLERLRYAWRGDELEARINYWLGRTYFEARQFVKGLNIMREAATISAGTGFAQRITNEMHEMFKHVYLSDVLETISPLDTVALYEQFAELIPEGDEGNRVVERLADRLTQADLLGRAGNLLDYQIQHRLKGGESYNTAVKLAAIRLLDGKSEQALSVLNLARQKFEALPEDQQTPDKIQDMLLLRARALSRQDKPEQAIALIETLEPNAALNRLRADIAWNAGKWDEAARALRDVILDQNISLTRPLSDENTTLILHRAVALNLAGDRVGLANMREKYSDLMAQTDKARVFEVITRPRQNAILADRETLLGVVAEVDLFKDFLNSYRSTSEPSQ